MLKGIIEMRSDMIDKQADQEGSLTLDNCECDSSTCDDRDCQVEDGGDHAATS